MENADPVRTPDELPWWAARGIVGLSLTWATGSRYAGGNAGDPDAGLTSAGRELAAAVDALGLVHDLAHLSAGGVSDLLELTSRPVIASHSNCRDLLGGRSGRGWQRHLDDDMIREVGQRGGVIGLNLYRNFVVLPAPRVGSAQPAAVSLERALDHVEHICQLQGHRRGVGLGSDLDGGFSAKQLVEGVRQPADFAHLAAGLAERGWTAEEIAGFTHQNWLRFFRENTGLA